MKQYYMISLHKGHFVIFHIISNRLSSLVRDLSKDYKLYEDVQSPDKHFIVIPSVDLSPFARK